MALYATIRACLQRLPPSPVVSFLLESSAILCGSWAQPMRGVMGQRAEICVGVFILRISRFCLLCLVQFCPSVRSPALLKHIPAAISRPRCGDSWWRLSVLCMLPQPVCVCVVCCYVHSCVCLWRSKVDMVSVSIALCLIFETGVTHWMWSSG